MMDRRTHTNVVMEITDLSESLFSLLFEFESTGIPPDHRLLSTQIDNLDKLVSELKSKLRDEDIGLAV